MHEVAQVSGRGTLPPPGVKPPPFPHFYFDLNILYELNQI